MTDPVAPDPIAIQLKAARQAAGMSLASLERKVDIQGLTVGSWERGDRNPPLTKVREWAGWFGFELLAIPQAESPLDTDWGVELSDGAIVACGTFAAASQVALRNNGAVIVHRQVRILPVGGWRMGEPS